MWGEQLLSLFFIAIFLFLRGMELVLPTSYFPPVSYMAALLSADQILIEAEETYPKQTLRNHCEIAGPNSRQRLTVPVSKPHGNQTKTKDIKIDYNLPWPRLHVRSINTAYNKSPFHLYYMVDLMPFFEKKYEFLLDLNLEILRILLKIMRINKTIEFTSEFQNSGNVFFSEKKDFADPSVYKPYIQVFGEKHGFMPDLSILDVLFNLGPEMGQYVMAL